MGKFKLGRNSILFLFICTASFSILAQKNLNAEVPSVIQTKAEEAKRAVRLRDYAKAAELYNYLANRGDTESQYQLGAFYLYGKGVRKDYAKALHFFKQAAEKKYQKAEFNLALMFENGWGTMRDYHSAILWYKRSAEHGNQQALLRVSKINNERDTPIIVSVDKEDALQEKAPVMLINPDRGIGFASGIFGTGLMLILFIYSLKKRTNKLEAAGSVRTWLRIHMALGILGPLLILLHCNFRAGSPNSSVALFSMLIVAVSGIIGRFLYARLHYGLYGKMANLVELKNELQQQKVEAALEFAAIPGVQEELFPFADYVLTPSAVLINSIKRFISIRWKSLITFWKIKRMVFVYAKKCARQNKTGRFERIRAQTYMLQKARLFIKQTIVVAEFNLYERMFSFWHFLHIPLVSILILSVIMHVTAANRY